MHLPFRRVNLKKLSGNLSGSDLDRILPHRLKRVLDPPSSRRRFSTGPPASSSFSSSADSVPTQPLASGPALTSLFSPIERRKSLSFIRLRSASPIAPLAVAANLSPSDCQRRGRDSAVFLPNSLFASFKKRRLFSGFGRGCESRLTGRDWRRDGITLSSSTERHDAGDARSTSGAGFGAWVSSHAPSIMASFPPMTTPFTAAWVFGPTACAVVFASRPRPASSCPNDYGHYSIKLSMRTTRVQWSVIAEI